jgi:hypothetical protein
MKLEIELTPQQLEQIRITQKWVKGSSPVDPVDPPPQTPLRTLTQTFLRGDGNVQRANIGGLKNLGISSVLSTGQLKEVTSLGFRLAKWPLQMPRERILPESWKQGVRDSAKLALESGVKINIRPQYHQMMNGYLLGFVPDMALIEAHIPQMGALFREILPALAYTEAGFLGTWAEWHSDANIRLADGAFHYANARKVFEGINEHYPKGLHRCVRYSKALVRQEGNPQGWFDWNENGQPFQNLWGVYNDFYGNGGSDASTYWPDRGNQPLSVDDRRMQNEQRSYVNRMAQFTYHVAEPVPVGGDRGQPWNVSPRTPLTRQGLIDKIMAEGISALNLDGQARMREWMQAEPALYRDLLGKLGYNLHTERVIFEVLERNRFKLTIDWVNTGSSGVLNPIATELVFAGGSASLFQIGASALPTSLGKTTTVSEGVLPALKAGKYPLGLRLSDRATGEKFCTQLNNRSMKFENGVNDLGMIYEV